MFHHKSNGKGISAIWYKLGRKL